MKCFGNSVLPKVELITSCLQQKLSDLTVGHRVSDNRMLKDVTVINPDIKYIRPRNGYEPALVTLSYAAHGTRDF